MFTFRRPPSRLARLLAPCLAFALPALATAKSVRVGDLRRPGFMRTPLYRNDGALDKTPSSGAAAKVVYYTPAQIRHAYGFDQLIAKGAGQTIAIVDAYGSPSIQSDLNLFCKDYGLPAATVTIYNAQKTPAPDAGWAQETSLDVEWAHAIAPSARIVLVVAQNSSVANLMGAVDYAVKTVKATVVSMSWGTSEFSGETAYDSHFNVAGVTFVAPSGDSAEGTDVDWPAASPYVTGVGGTSLYLDANGNRTSPEVAWSSSGGGVSAVYARPSYQTGWKTTPARGVPDVSYVADPKTGVLVVYAGALYVFGGTSVGAPQWAALVAVSNSMRSLGALGSANNAIYAVARGTSSAPYTINPASFYDITSGSNGNDADDFAVRGYDLVTGLGSPAAAQLVPALSTRPASVPSTAAP